MASDAQLVGTVLAYPAQSPRAKSVIRWAPPLLVGGLAVWLGAQVVVTPQGFRIAGPFLIPALSLIEIVVVYLSWGSPVGEGGADLVVTERGVIRRLPHLWLFIPWALTEAPRKLRWPVEDVLPFRLTSNAPWAGGRLPLAPGMGAVVERYRPTTRPRPVREAALGTVGPATAPLSSGETEPVTWPPFQGGKLQVVRIAREPAASTMTRFALTILLLVAAVVSLCVGYVFGSLLVSAAYYLPLPAGVWLSRRAADHARTRTRALLLVVGPVLALLLGLVLALILLGWSAFGVPRVYAVLSSLSLLMGMGIGGPTTIAIRRPDLLG